MGPKVEILRRVVLESGRLRIRAMAEGLDSIASLLENVQRKARTKLGQNSILSSDPKIVRLVERLRA